MDASASRRAKCRAPLLDSHSGGLLQLLQEKAKELVRILLSSRTERGGDHPDRLDDLHGRVVILLRHDLLDEAFKAAKDAVRTRMTCVQ